MTHGGRRAGAGAPSRAGAPTRPVTVRATDAERATWERISIVAGCENLSAWIVKTLNEQARIASECIASANPRRNRRRCRVCNQLLVALGDVVEPHMEPPAPTGERPKLCLGGYPATNPKRRSKA
jgi:hypothetical protein